jgi:hypothetical protein
MKFLRKTIVCCLCAIFSILFCTGCVDLGVGEDENAFKKYFSSVYVLSRTGIKQFNIAEFNRNITLEDMGVPVVPALGYGQYSYIGFRVAGNYEVSIDEFAFFAKTAGDAGQLDLEFYVVKHMPTKIQIDDENTADGIPKDDEQAGENSSADSASASGGETGDESEDITEDEVFNESSLCFVSHFSVENEWNSVLLEFEEVEVVPPKWFIVVRIRNNCYIKNEDEEETPPVSFTFNYLMCHCADVRKV